MIWQNTGSRYMETFWWTGSQSKASLDVWWGEGCYEILW